MPKIIRRDFLAIAGTSMSGVYLGGLAHLSAGFPTGRSLEALHAGFLEPDLRHCALGQTASRFASQIRRPTRGRSAKVLGFLRRSIRTAGSGQRRLCLSSRGKFAAWPTDTPSAVRGHPVGPRGFAVAAPASRFSHHCWLFMSVGSDFFIVYFIAVDSPRTILNAEIHPVALLLEHDFRLVSSKVHG
jgi:hypothetical protein